MSTLKWIVALGFLVAFGAGFVTRMRLYPVSVTAVPSPGPQPLPPTRPAGPGRPPLDDILNLTPEQRVKAKEIWEPLGRFGPRQDEEKRAEARTARDEAITALIAAERRAEYEKIRTEYQDRLRQIDQERRAAWENARERFLAILTPEQRAKYDEIVSRRDHGGRGRDHATSRPATQRKPN